MYKDQISLNGTISKIYDSKDKRYIWFDICKNEKYVNKDNEEVSKSSFFSARIKKERFDESIYKVGIRVYVEGIPKSYLNKNIKNFYIQVINIKQLHNNENIDNLLFDYNLYDTE